MANADFGDLAKRLDRIERALARLGGLDDLISPVDPPPDDLVRIRADLLRHRLIDLIRQLIPKGDPPPEDLVRGGGAQLLEARLGDILRRNPGWFTDPPPEDFLNIRVLDLVRRWRGGFSDPAPEDLANVRLRDLIQRLPGGGVTDPSPEDIARLTRPELEAQLHKINAETLRLKSMEQLINDRLGGLKEDGPPG
jgi:hypothetical protein